jgi:Domain of unknown function (DUF4157)
LAPGLAEAYGAWLGADVSDVRLHTGSRAAREADALGAEAFTVGRDVSIGGGVSGLPPSRLLAHELTHAVQGGPSGSVRRKPLDETPTDEIMADPTYFENGELRVEFYFAEQARLIYPDGSSYDLGLVPEWAKAPVEAVDYHTQRTHHLVVRPPGGNVGSVRFVPNITALKAPQGTSISQVIESAGRTIRFVRESKTGRIMPTEVNTITAPRLCAALLGAEQEYVKNTDAIAKGMVKGLKVLEIALFLYPGSWVARGGGAVGKGAAAARGGAAAGTVAAEAATTGTLRALFVRLLGSGAAETVTVEGVTFGTVRASMRGTEMVVTRFSIENVGRVAGQGRFMHGVYERAVVEAAKAAGARSARVAVETVINPGWRAYLEGQGYAIELIETAGGGFSKVWSKVLPL